MPTCENHCVIRDCAWCAMQTVVRDTFRSRQFRLSYKVFSMFMCFTLNLLLSERLKPLSPAVCWIFVCKYYDMRFCRIIVICEVCYYTIFGCGVSGKGAECFFFSLLFRFCYTAVFIVIIKLVNNRYKSDGFPVISGVAVLIVPVIILDILVKLRNRTRNLWYLLVIWF